MFQPGSCALAATALLLIGAGVGALAGRWRGRAAAARRGEDDTRQAAERIAALSAANAELARDRDLLQQSQRLGKLGYIISDLALDRVYWSDSLFELRRVPKRAYFTFAEGIAFVHPDDRERFFALRTAAVAERRDWELDNRILRGDGTTS
ncbi:MAG TPA: hypothetical protein VMU42_09010, partial [Candidatus Sulfotelmatobacter sp.]|nr:hypothetical protein [Candidatus Sulfotelmatobacter sp.]